MTKTHVIYVPGLGDSFDTARVFTVGLWKMHGLGASCTPMRWSSKESYEQKLQRLLDDIDRKDSVILVGESAGGAIALRAAEISPKVRACVTLCGISTSAMRVGDGYSRRAPALRTAVSRIPSTHTSRVHSIYSALDLTVPPRYAVAKGATVHRIYVPGHLFAIAAGLVWKVPRVIRKYLAD